MRFDDIPSGDRSKIKNRLIQQINAMDESELRIAAQTKESLASFVADAFRTIAKALGYIISYPIGLAVRVVENIWDGIQDGFSSGWRAGYED